MQKQQYEIHSAATLFPLMSEVEYQGLKQDISENGQREDIVLWCGKLIDGRNRLRACEELGRTPHIAELDEEHDPWKYVISHNLHRRHLTESQRGMVAAKLAKLSRGGDRKSEKIKVSIDTSMDDAASQLNVGRATVARAKTVQQHGSESLNQAVEQGDIPVSLAAKVAKSVPDKAEQDKIVKAGVVAARKATEKKQIDLPPIANANPVDRSAESDSKLNALRPLVFALNREQLIVVQEWIQSRLR